MVGKLPNLPTEYPVTAVAVAYAVFRAAKVATDAGAVQEYIPTSAAPLLAASTNPLQLKQPFTELVEKVYGTNPYLQV